MVTGLIVLPGMMGMTGNTDAAAIGALLLAPLGAIVSGIVLGVRVGKSTGTRVLWSLLLFVGCLTRISGACANAPWRSAAGSGCQ
jgi:hypothetical protein